MEIVHSLLQTPAAWRGRDEHRSTDWIYELSDAEVADLHAGLVPTARAPERVA